MMRVRLVVVVCYISFSLSCCVVRPTQVAEKGKLSEEEDIQAFKKELIAAYNPTLDNCQPSSTTKEKETSILNQHTESPEGLSYDYVGSFQAHLACMLAGYKDVSEVILRPEDLKQLDENGLTDKVLTSLGIHKHKKETYQNTYFYYTDKGKENALLLNKLSQELEPIRKKMNSSEKLTSDEEQLSKVAMFITGMLLGYTDSNIRDFYIYRFEAVGKDRLDGYKKIALAWIKENMETLEKEQEMKKSKA
jgi:hypothetical protein